MNAGGEKNRDRTFAGNAGLDVLSRKTLDGRAVGKAASRRRTRYFFQKRMMPA